MLKDFFSFFGKYGRLLRVIKRKVTRPSFKVRFTTEGLMYAIIPEYGALSFDVVDVSESGFALRIKDEPHWGEYEKFLNSILRDKKTNFKIKLFLVPGEDLQAGSPFHSIEVEAKIRAVGPDGEFGFEVYRDYRKRLKKLLGFLESQLVFRPMWTMTAKMSNGQNAGRELNQGFVEGCERSESRRNVFETSLFTAYLLSLLEEKRESVFQARVRFGMYLLFFAIFLVTGFVPGMLSQFVREGNLRSTVEQYEKKHNAKVFYLVHRKRQVGFFGIPVYEYLEVRDAHRLLAELKETPQNKNIVLVIHSPGGELLAGMQIAKMLKNWKGKVTVVVPYYAMSAGTLIALSTDEIYANKGTTFGPVDPQIPVDPGRGKTVSAVDVLRVCSSKEKKKFSLEEMIMCEVSRKAVNQVREFLEDVVLNGKPESVKKTIIESLLYTEKTHDFPFFADNLKKLGLNVKENVPEELKSIVNNLAVM